MIRSNALDKKAKHNLDLVVDRIVVEPERPRAC